MMDVILKCGELARELGLSQKIVARKSTIPALSHVLVEADGADGVRLTATDLEVGLRTTCAGALTGTVEPVLLPARKLHEIVRLLAPDAQVRLYRKDAKSQVQVTSDPYDSRLQTLTVEDFPAVAAPNGQAGVLLSSAALAQMIAQVQFAQGANDQRYFLNGAQLTLAGEKMTLAASDGHRLAISSAPRAAGAEGIALLPTKTLAELAPILDGADDVVFRDGQNHLWFDVGARQLVSRVVDGQFPNYERMIPVGNDKRATVDRDRFALAVKRVALVTSDAERNVRIALESGAITVSASSQEVGDATERVVVAYDGEAIAVRVNVQYTLDFLEAAAPGDVSIELKDPTKAVLLRQLAGAPATYLYVLMPVNR